MFQKSQNMLKFMFLTIPYEYEISRKKVVISKKVLEHIHVWMANFTSQNV